MNIHLQQILGTISNEASQNAGAFLIKSLELQQAIEQSTRDYKIFWGWLYGVIIRFLEESVPDEVAAVSQQDITYLAEFLNTFDQDEELGEGKYGFLNVGQFMLFIPMFSLQSNQARSVNSTLNVLANT